MQRKERLATVPSKTIQEQEEAKSEIAGLDAKTVAKKVYAEWAKPFKYGEEYSEANIERVIESSSLIARFNQALATTYAGDVPLSSFLGKKRLTERELASFEQTFNEMANSLRRNPNLEAIAIAGESPGSPMLDFGDMKLIYEFAVVSIRAHILDRIHRAYSSNVMDLKRHGKLPKHQEPVDKRYFDSILALVKKEQWQKTIESCNEYISKAGESLQFAHYFKGYALYKQGKKDEANLELEKAAQADPTFYFPKFK